MKLDIWICAGFALALSGCAAASYGRLEPVSPAEAHLLACADIDLELMRVEGFLDQVRPDPAWRPAAHIGQADRAAARRSGEARRDQLKLMRANLGCEGAAV
ncbi:MAG: hypothetical protein AB7O04_00855 [Hyphomonadaceae bacterium]